MPGLQTDTMERVVERLKQKATESAPVSFSLGWAVREESEALDQTIRRADQHLIRIRVAERLHQSRA